MLPITSDAAGATVTRRVGLQTPAPLPSSSPRYPQTPPPLPSKKRRTPGGEEINPGSPSGGVDPYDYSGPIPTHTAAPVAAPNWDDTSISGFSTTAAPGGKVSCPPQINPPVRARVLHRVCGGAAEEEHLQVFYTPTDNLSLHLTAIRAVSLDFRRPAPALPHTVARFSDVDPTNPNSGPTAHARCDRGSARDDRRHAQR